MDTDFEGKVEGKKMNAEGNEGGRDCVAMMEVVRSHPEVLANVLREMGVSESGDEVSEGE